MYKENYNCNKQLSELTAKNNLYVMFRFAKQSQRKMQVMIFCIMHFLMDYFHILVFLKTSVVNKTKINNCNA